MYSVIITLSVFLIVFLNMCFAFSVTTVINLIIAFAFVLVPSIVFLVLIRFLPKKFFSVGIFKVSKKEYKLYNKLKIKEWKSYIPECGELVKFKKDKFNDNPKDKTYISKFIYETLYSELTHSFAIISSIIGFMFLPNSIKLNMGLPILLVYVVLNIPPIIIQRYNRYRLKVLLKKLEKEESKSENNEEIVNTKKAI